MWFHLYKFEKHNNQVCCLEIVRFSGKTKNIKFRIVTPTVAERKRWNHRGQRAVPKCKIHVFFLFVLFIYLFITLQYCIGFAMHWHESTMGIHVFPLLNPPPTYLPPYPSLTGMTQRDACFLNWRMGLGDLLLGCQFFSSIICLRYIRSQVFSTAYDFCGKALVYFACHSVGLKFLLKSRISKWFITHQHIASNINIASLMLSRMNT